MAKTKKQTKSIIYAYADNTDGVFALKLALYIILGSIWAKITVGDMQVPIPIGLIAGMLLTAHEKLKIDRKIEYAVLLVAALIGFWAPFGLYIAL